MTEVLILLLVVAVGWLIVAQVLERHGAADEPPTATPELLPPSPEPPPAPAPPRLDPTAARHLAAFSARDGSKADTPEDGAPGPASTQVARRDPTTPAPGPTTRRTRLFGLGGRDAGPHRHTGPYAAVGVVTTGFAPMKDRVVELTVLSLDPTGTVEEEYTTLLHRQGRDPGASFLHGLSAGELDHAPSMRAIAPEILRRLSGRVVVAHHAELLEQFLDAALMEAGVLAPSQPALCTFRLGAQTFPTPNHRRATLAAHLDLPLRTGESSSADAHLAAALLRPILERHGRSLSYPCPPAPELGPVPGLPAPVGRAHRPIGGSGADPWLADLFARTSTSAVELGDPRVASYVEALTNVLSQGRVVTPEVRTLTGLLVQAGYSAQQVRGVHERLLESLRQAAFTRRKLSTTRLRHLRATATSLSIPTYFDDLVPPPPPPAPEPGSGSFARPVRKPLPAAPPAHLPRCGHCLAVGHYTSACPRREHGPVSPVRPIE